jgi:N-dimethylarginine dimethylaminohydrolase
MSARRYLMCRPTHFSVDYAINPWMDPTAGVDVELAIAQWTALREAYLALGHTVEEIEPIAGLPDMVFAANGATAIDGIAYIAQFRHPERAPEAGAYLNWFAGNGFDPVEAKQVNEGEGDLLLTDRYLLAGTGFRTEPAAHLEAQELFGRPVISLQLVDGRRWQTASHLCPPRRHRDHDPRRTTRAGRGRPRRGYRGVLGHPGRRPATGCR